MLVEERESIWEGGWNMATIPGWVTSLKINGDAMSIKTKTEYALLWTVLWLSQSPFSISSKNGLQW